MTQLKRPSRYRFAMMLVLVAMVVVSGSALTRTLSVSSVEASAADLLLPIPADESESVVSTTLSGTVASPLSCTLTVASTKVQKTVGEVRTVLYTLEVKNISQRSCSNVSLSAYYEEAMRIVAVTPAATAGSYYWRLGDVAPGATKVLSIEVAAAGDSANGLEACATADNGADACVVGASVVPVEVPPATPVASAPVSPVTALPVQPTTTTSTEDEYGMWVWESPEDMSVAYIESLMTAVRTHGFTALYVTVDDYLAIHSLPAGPAKEAKKQAYFNAIERLVIEANKNEVAIDALAGAKDWAQPAMRYKAYAIVDMVLAYNAARPTNPLRSLQYDVEPYLLSTYERNKAPILTEFVALIDETSKRLGSSTVRFAVTIPHFYDSAQAWTPKITYQGITTHTFTHLLRILDTRKDSTIILMSYRNFAEGNNGTIQISNVEVVEASAVPRSTKVIVGQEFGKVSPLYVTFFGKTRAYYESELAKVTSAFAKQSGFGGTAVHYFEPFSVLR